MPRRKSIDDRITETQDAIASWERKAALAATKLRKYRRREAALYRKYCAGFHLTNSITKTITTIRSKGRRFP